MTDSDKFVSVVVVDTARILNWDSFHSVFQTSFGFFDGYGRNMDAWIDCMGSLSDPPPGLSEVRVAIGSTLTLQLLNVAAFKGRCPDIYDALIECSAFVNLRSVEANEPPSIALAYHC